MSGTVSKRLAVTPTVSANGAAVVSNRSGGRWNETLYQYENPHKLVASNGSEADDAHNFFKGQRLALPGEPGSDGMQPRKALSGQSMEQIPEL